MALCNTQAGLICSLKQQFFFFLLTESVHGEVTSMNSDGSITKFGHPQHNEEYDNSKHDAAEQQLELELKKPIKKLEFASTTRKLPKQNVDYVCIDHQTDTQLLRVPNTEPVGINRQLGDHGKAPKEDNEQLLRDHIRKQNTVIQQQKAHNEQLMCRQNELETTNHKLQDRIRELEADRQQRRDCISFAVKHVLFKEDMKRGKTKKHTIIVVSRQEYQHCFALGHRFKLRNKMFITTKPLYIICVELDENDQPMDVIEGPAFIKFATNEAETQVKHLENYFSEYDQTSVDSLFLTNCPYPYNENISNASMVALFKDKCDVAIDEKCVECEKRNNGIKIKFQNDSDRLKVFLNAKEKLVSTDTNIEVWLTEYQQIQRLILKRVKIPYEDDGKGNLYVETSEGREHVDTLGRVFEIAEHCQNDQFWWQYKCTKVLFVDSMVPRRQHCQGNEHCMAVVWNAK